MQCASETIKDIQATWEAFTNHLRSAKRVRFFDGFLGRKSLELLHGLGTEDVAVVKMPPGRVPNNGRTMNLSSVRLGEDLKDWLIRWATDIGMHVRDGKNIMVFYPFVVPKEHWPGIEEIVVTIARVAGIPMDDTVIQTGAMSDQVKKWFFSDVNRHWRARVVATNSGHFRRGFYRAPLPLSLRVRFWLSAGERDHPVVVPGEGCPR